MLPSSDPTRSATRLLLLTLLAVPIFLFVAVMISQALIDVTDLDATARTAAGRQAMRLAALASNLLPFTGAAAVALLIVFRDHWAASVALDRSPAPHSVYWSVLFFLVALPLVGYLAYENLQLELPEWAQASEDSTDALLMGLLRMESLPEFVLAFLTIAVSPALGEELLMRGVLQRRVFRVWFGNAHVAIWLAAFLFSFVHFEFGGFAPRFLLGILLGYAYYWSTSLWVPIGLHLVFNGIQVVTAYVTGEFDPTASAADEVPLWLGLGSFLLAGGVFYLAQQRFGGRADPFAALGPPAEGPSGS